MSKNDWFFKRQFARLCWELLPEWAAYVTISMSGQGRAWEKRPKCYKHDWYAVTGQSVPVCHVGVSCPDWRDLIFERPQEEVGFSWVTVKNPHRVVYTPLLSPRPQEPAREPLITAEEWRAIRLLLPGARWVAKDDGGNVWATDEEPHTIASTFWSRGFPGDEHCLRLFALKSRFAAIPWRESRVEYQEADHEHEPR